MLPPITITMVDDQRLKNLIATRVGLAYRVESRRLRDELRRATVVRSDSAPATLVTMNCKVIYADLDRGTSKEATLVYPWNANGKATLSILSAEGTALLGLRVGDAITWQVDDHTIRTLRVLAIPYQPEAAGHYHL